MFAVRDFRNLMLGEEGGEVLLGVMLGPGSKEPPLLLLLFLAERVRRTPSISAHCCCDSCTSIEAEAWAYAGSRYAPPAPTPPAGPVGGLGGGFDDKVCG
eukprot:CAMPEP_0173252910 /NCGR_PEP_ID=MMETSP1142-20121109/21017_1 /TAXON_ID=483371 /ORGANISM="non described non described, Strain CCMP2298" /LENGTH=99 /DNA_ID=CAMNT_0014186061 /DNA_START=73 /DNA_END=369 /DNA_ORIENTATION=+